MKPDEQQLAMITNQKLNVAVAVGAGIGAGILAHAVLPPLLFADSFVILQRLIVAGLIGGATYVVCKEVKCGELISTYSENIPVVSKKTYVTLVISEREREFLELLKKEELTLDENRARSLVSKYRWVSYLSKEDWERDIKRLYEGKTSASEGDEYAVRLVKFELEKPDKRFESKSNSSDLSDALREVGQKGVKVEVSGPLSLSDLPSGPFYPI
ncbi:MAG: hypothetical protein BWK78_04795 [Thiotrichaceae bacterium IS1]|nr:MAG: hypothetical protein BWK78_04795 [Thiotrichaceae bacterium IS1]